MKTKEINYQGTDINWFFPENYYELHKQYETEVYQSMCFSPTQDKIIEAHLHLVEHYNGMFGRVPHTDVVMVSFDGGKTGIQISEK